MRRLPLVVAGLIFAASTPVSAQSVEDVLGRYSGANAQGFLGPLADFIGATLNSGWARSARVDPGFGMRLSFVLTGAPISDSRRTFTGVTDGGFSPQTSTQAPTVFGDEDPVIVDGQGGTQYIFPGGINASLLGTVVPQLSIGSFAGTMVSARWLGLDIDDDLGKVSLLGLGARHDLGRYLQNLPVDLAIGAYWQSFEIGDIVEVSALTAVLHASRPMGLLTLYGGVGYEKSTTDIRYTISGQPGEVNVSLDGANSVRGTAGLSLRLAFLELFADYSLASQNAFTLGLGFGK